MQVRYLGCECENASARTPLPLIRIFMEYVSGGSLSKTLRTFGPMDEPLIRRYTLQIVEGLAHVHMHNIAHRDIKGAWVGPGRGLLLGLVVLLGLVERGSVGMLWEGGGGG